MKSPKHTAPVPIFDNLDVIGDCRRSEASKNSVGRFFAYGKSDDGAGSGYEAALKSLISYNGSKKSSTRIAVMLSVSVSFLSVC